MRIQTLTWTKQNPDCLGLIGVFPIRVAHWKKKEKWVILYRFLFPLHTAASLDLHNAALPPPPLPTLPSRSPPPSSHQLNWLLTGLQAFWLTFSLFSSQQPGEWLEHRNKIRSFPAEKVQMASSHHTEGRDKCFPFPTRPHALCLSRHLLHAPRLSTIQQAPALLSLPGTRQFFASVWRSFAPASSSSHESLLSCQPTSSLMTPLQRGLLDCSAWRAIHRHTQTGQFLPYHCVSFHGTYQYLKISWLSLGFLVCYLSC